MSLGSELKPKPASSARRMSPGMRMPATVLSMMALASPMLTPGARL